LRILLKQKILSFKYLILLEPSELITKVFVVLIELKEVSDVKTLERNIPDIAFAFWEYLLLIHR
jgi:hypothetical protein